MKVALKALRTKPQISLLTAIGSMELKAESLADACLLTAVASAFSNLAGDIPSKGLLAEIVVCAHAVAKRINKHEPPFEMIIPKKRKP